MWCPIFCENDRCVYGMKLSPMTLKWCVNWNWFRSDVWYVAVGSCLITHHFLNTYLCHAIVGSAKLKRPRLPTIKSSQFTSILMNILLRAHCDILDVKLIAKWYSIWCALQTFTDRQVCHRLGQDNGEWSTALCVVVDLSNCCRRRTEQRGGRHHRHTN